MRQAQHIFLKDVRFLKYEISLILALTAAFIWAGTRGMIFATNGGLIELLLLATTNFLIARLVHAEAIPGDRQFWITRPYHWKSLLAAKLVFVLIFVQVPVLLAQALILLANGFPVLTNIPGLLWTQLLIATVVSLPVVALAAVTSGTVQFVLAALVALAVASASTWRIMPFGSLNLGPIDWVRASIGILMLLAISVTVLYWQYRTRRTGFSRSVLFIGLAIAGLVYLAIPWTLAFGVQQRLSRQAFDTGKLQGSFEPYMRPRFGRLDGQQFDIVLPFVVTGLAEETDFRADAMSVELESPAGKKWEWMFYDLPKDYKYSNGQRTVTLQGLQTLSHETAQAVKGSHNARVALFLTIFGNSKTAKIPLQEQPVNVFDGLQCYTGAGNREGDILCRSVFRWPARIIDARVDGYGASAFTQFISYSPFPADLRLQPVETRWASAYTSREPPKSREVTIAIKEPTAFVRRDFEFEGIQIRDWARPLPVQYRQDFK